MLRNQGPLLTFFRRAATPQTFLEKFFATKDEGRSPTGQGL